MNNTITDVPGVLIGSVHDASVATGVTVALFEEPATASVAVLGGAPGTRDTDMLSPEMTVQKVDALVLSGGSCFGLDAAGGVLNGLAEQGRGFQIRTARVPIAPQAIIFDLLNGGNKAWGRKPPYFDLGRAALDAASKPMELGTIGAGYGATTARLKGGLGSASIQTASGYTVGAVVVVNAVGTATVGNGPHFWAAPYELNAEFGGLGFPHPFPADALTMQLKGGPAENTTIAIIATDATLTKAEAKRIALASHDGLARAIRPAHTPLDGDVVFAAGTGRAPAPADPAILNELCVAAADVLARAIARGVYEATALPFARALPSWKDRFGR